MSDIINVDYGRRQGITENEFIDPEEITNRNNEVFGYNVDLNLDELCGSGESNNNDNNSNNNNRMLKETTDSYDTQFKGSFSNGSYISYLPSSLYPPHENF
ncbi:hypothetical protein Glove_372g11 [Diversispora epigaea]|uniref:Uncharacterized protein n=1 Tax=Diversispora epigaea TaxID=1348612 RepID=A0A397HB42_9GLOM|nr:hypothetical protein Glove_372g11 [Diversispora epigaea]